MKRVIMFCLFTAYSIAVFLIQSWYVIIAATIFNVSIMLLFSISIKKAVKNLIALSPFILFTVIMNAILMEGIEAVQVGVKLVIVCNITYSYSKLITAMQLAKIIEILMTPLKIFKINPQEIGIIIAIAISFLPIFKQELLQIVTALKVKGIQMKVTNMKYILKPILVSILKRTNEMELAMRAKAYE